MTILERIFAKTRVQDNGCRVFEGGTAGNGYGRINIKGTIKRVHRVVYREWYGDFPTEMYVLHKCDNRACCNPDHLFLGTHLDNMADMNKKGRRADTHGSNSPRALLTEDDIHVIRKLLSDNFTGVEIAELYFVSPSTISSIKHRKNWKEC